MKYVLVLLSYVAACACEDDVADAVASVDSAISADSVPVAPDSVASSANSRGSLGYIDRGYGTYSSGYESSNYGGSFEARRGYEGRRGYEAIGGYENRGSSEATGGYDGRRGYEAREGYEGRGYNNGYRNDGYAEKDLYTFFIPRLVGRQGLGFQKRNFYSGSMRWPVTPEILKPIGYRPTLKELYFEPLPKYNY